MLSTLNQSKRLWTRFLLPVSQSSSLSISPAYRQFCNKSKAETKKEAASEKDEDEKVDPKTHEEEENNLTKEDI